MKKLVIIPAYNESASILKVIDNIRLEAPDYDYIVVNDCSTDNTRDILEANHIPYLDCAVNLGIGGAVQTGYLYAYRNKYDIAIQFDGDGQHNASYFYAMENALKNEASDMVIGSRFISNEGFQSSALRRFGIRFFNILIKILTGENITDPTSGMRMLNRNTIELFSRDYPGDYPEPESVVYLLNLKKKITEVPVVMNERTEGKSSINGFKSMYYMIKVTTAIIICKLNKGV